MTISHFSRCARRRLPQVCLASLLFSLTSFPSSVALAQVDEGASEEKPEPERDDADGPAPEESAAPEGPAPEPSEEAETKSDAAQEEQPPAKGAGLRLILFIESAEGQEPSVERSQAKVTVSGVEGKTNESGAVTLEGLTPGFHELRVEIQGASVDPVVLKGVGFGAGEVTQVLLTVDGAGLLVGQDIESPEGIGEPEAEEEQKDEAALKTPGTLSGIALDAETGAPIGGVQVYVRGIDEPFKTDEKGRFSVEVPEGLHDLSVLHSKYASVTREGVEVKPKETTEVELKLSPSSAELEDMVITEPFVQGGVSSGVAEEKDSSAVQDVIGAEQMSKSGASDASAALSRVTGLTVVGGKFIYVRGMGERYSSTLLNGAQVPSPEPERRVVPLDLFPTTVLESVVVQKTYSPNMPGEFGGGAVQLRTRSFPEEFLFNVGVTTSGNTNTTFNKGPTYDGGKTDWLGFDDGTRARSDELAKESTKGDPLRKGNMFAPGLSSEEIAALGRSLPNNWNTHERTIPPNGKLNVTVGDTLKPLGIPVGYVSAVQYSNDWQYREEERRSVTVSDGEAVTATSFDVRRSVNTIGLTGMLGLGVTPFEGQSLFSNTMVLRSTDNTTLLGAGNGLEGDERWTRLRFVERQLFTQQFRGEHLIEPLSNLKIDWRFVKSFADRAEPDRRDYRYDYAEDLDAYLLSVRGGAVNRFYSSLNDKITEGGLDVTLPISWTDELTTKLMAGGMLLGREREVTTFRYQYAIDTYQPVDERLRLREEDMETIFQPDNIGTGLAEFAETTGPDESYDASQDIAAAYLMVETPLYFKSVNLMAGARYEKSIQRVESTNEKARLATGDWLPASTLTWAFVEDMQVRGGYSKTVSRPDFRELALARFFDVETSTEIVGNPDLKRATIQNYDVRYEWYFSGDESLSLAGFYKEFDEPIETVVLAGTSRKRSWQNADSATNTGIEIEARKRLGFMAEPLDSFFVAGNLSLIRSRIHLAESVEGERELVNTTSERPLEGQSPYVLNLQFGYDDALGPDGNLSATVLFNISGRRIDGVGANGAPDSYQEATPQLDFVTSHRVDENWNWTLKLQNLLNPEVKTTQGDVETLLYKSGVNVSLGASYTY